MITKIHKQKITRAWQGVDRRSLAKKLKTSIRVIDQYATGSELVSARRAVIIELLAGIPADIMRPDIFIGRK